MPNFTKLLVSTGFKFFLVVLAPLQAFAWGELGHKVTAEISFRRLNPAAKAQIAELLGSTAYNDASLWADIVKRKPEWQHTRSYHYVDIPDNMTYFSHLAALSTEEQKKGDALMSILQAEEVLRNRSADRKARAAALRFILHILSDMHQPLHAGRPEDKGGNEIFLNWYGKNVRLHALWDTNLMETAHSEQFDGKPTNEKVSWYASYLENKYDTKNEPCKADMLAWLNTSLTLREVSYRGYDGDNDAYLTATLPTAEKQLFAAGNHMACLLNLALLDPVRKPPTEDDLRIQLGKVLKVPLTSIISLDPQNDPQNGFDQNVVGLVRGKSSSHGGHTHDDFEDCH